MASRLSVVRRGGGHPVKARFTVLLMLLACASAPSRAETRRVALRLDPALLPAPEIQRLTGWAAREGVEIDVASDATPVRPGWESVWAATLPLSPAVSRLLSNFPVRVEKAGFSFDGRSYREPQDAIALAQPSDRRETIVIGNGARAVLRLAARRVFWSESPAQDYVAVSGDLTKEGRFAVGVRPLTIDRSTDRDEIGAQDKFVASLQTEEHGGVRWRLREADRAAIARWEPVLRRFLGRERPEPILVRLYPDASSKARACGSSRPADLSGTKGDLVIDLDVSAPNDPDGVTPVLAAAALASRQPGLLSHPILLAALGARASGRWWGRDVASFAGFLHAARVEPTVEQVLKEDPEVSPIFAIGAAAAWLEAGAREEGEAAVLRAAAADGSECARLLTRWAQRAEREPFRAPPRRALPGGFLRGVSYAMSNSVSGGYASPRSRETLIRLSHLAVGAISVMPFAFSRDAKAPDIEFVHRDPRGETDEGIVRAVSDARALGMTAMLKPQIWLPGAFVGDVSMESEVAWRRWFDGYRRFVVHNAIVAEASGAAILCVGTELTGTEARRREWLDTIAAVRLATGAPLTYASNWASDAPRVSFWDVLDAVGVDFYDGLSKSTGATDLQLDEGVRRAAAPLAELARKTGKPILFTEAGYPPVRGAWIDPHDENTGRPNAPDDAARAVAAVFRTLQRETWWKGVYWWKVFSDGRDARAGERGFNLLGSAAEKEIARQFGRMACEKRASK